MAQSLFISMLARSYLRGTIYDWAPYQQFCNFFLFPLYLYASGNDRVARWLLRDYLAGVTDEDLLHTLPLSFKMRHPCRTLGVAIPKWVGKVFERLPENCSSGFCRFRKQSTAVRQAAN